MLVISTSHEIEPVASSWFHVSKATLNPERSSPIKSIAGWLIVEAWTKELDCGIPDISEGVIPFNWVINPAIIALLASTSSFVANCSICPDIGLDLYLPFITSSSNEIIPVASRGCQLLIITWDPLSNPLVVRLVGIICSDGNLV